MPVDVATLVDYDFLYELELRNPRNDEPLGIKFQIRSASSEAAKEILRRHSDKNIERRMKGKLIKGETLERQELEKAASYIASWDWGDNKYAGEVPELSMKKAIDILSKESWIYQQVVEAANDIENFSRRPTGTSANSST